MHSHYANIKQIEYKKIRGKKTGVTTIRINALGRGIVIYCFSPADRDAGTDERGSLLHAVDSGRDRDRSLVLISQCH
jgi:hypothetical protein